MPIIEFTAKDLLRTRILPPAWYRVLIERTAEKLSKIGYWKEPFNSTLTTVIRNLLEFLHLIGDSIAR